MWHVGDRGQEDDVAVICKGHLLTKSSVRPFLVFANLIWVRGTKSRDPFGVMSELQ